MSPVAPMLEAAQAAAASGLAVIWQQGKSAVAAGWNKGPANAPEALAATYRPGLNVAFRAGPTSKLNGRPVAVVDVDLRSDDEDDRKAAWDAFCALVGKVKPTVRTGGGGAHLYLTFSPGALPRAPSTVLARSPRKTEAGKPAWTIELLSAEHACTMPPSIHPSGRAYEWVNGGLSHVMEAPERLLAALQSVDADSVGVPHRCAPEPLRRSIPPPEPYPLDELGTVLTPAAEALQRVIQAPDAICGASILAAASLATQHLADVGIDGRRYPLSLWLLSVAESGERKSAVDTEAMRPARDYEKFLAAEYAEALNAHATEHAEWQARCEAAKGEAKKARGEGLSQALQHIGSAPEPPLLPKVIVGDFTAEGLAKMLAAGRPSIGAFTDEAALVFGGHGMTKETVMRTAGTLCKLWDRGELDRVRASDGAVKLYGRRLALHLMAQPVIAERALSDVVLAGQGFLARCLLAWPESTAGRRPYVAESLVDDAALVRYRGRLSELMGSPLPLTEGQRQELAPRLLVLTDEAARVWRGLHDKVEAGMGPGGSFAAVRPWASKTPEQVLRVAGVLTLIDQPAAELIEASTIERAADLALWHLNEAARLAGTAELSPEVRDAEALLGWCHETRRLHLHSGAALRLGPARIRERERFAAAMGELERAGWAERIGGGMELDDKHRRNVWRIIAASEGG